MPQRWSVSTASSQIQITSVSGMFLSSVWKFMLNIWQFYFLWKWTEHCLPWYQQKKKPNSHSFATGMLKEMLDWNVGNFHCQYSLPFASQTKKDEMPISIFIMEKFLVYSQIYWGNRDTGTIRHLQSFWFLMRWKSLYYLIFLNKFHYLKGNESWLTEMLHCF